MGRCPRSAIASRRHTAAAVGPGRCVPDRQYPDRIANRCRCRHLRADRHGSRCVLAGRGSGTDGLLVPTCCIRATEDGRRRHGRLLRAPSARSTTAVLGSAETLANITLRRGGGWDAGFAARTPHAAPREKRNRAGDPCSDRQTTLTARHLSRLCNEFTQPARASRANPTSLPHRATRPPAGRSSPPPIQYPGPARSARPDRQLRHTRIVVMGEAFLGCWIGWMIESAPFPDVRPAVKQGHDPARWREAVFHQRRFRSLCP